MDTTARSSAHGFSRQLHSIKERAEIGAMTLQQLVDMLGPRGSGFLALFLVVPFLQPVPLFGLSTPFGLTIAVIGYFMAQNKPPRLPQRFAKVEIAQNLLLKLCSGFETLMTKVERFVKPRASHLALHPPLRIFNGLMISIHAIILALPIPIPGTNTAPSFVIAFLALGMVEEDGWFILLGYLAAVLDLAFFAALVLLPWLGYKSLS